MKTNRENLLNAHESFMWLADACSNTGGDISLCSAYIRHDALSSVLKNWPGKNGGRILARWKLEDFISNASDFDSYHLACDLGLDFYIRQDFHGKVFHIPNVGILLGSANVTSRGLGLSSVSNLEVCSLLPENEKNSAFIENCFRDATKVSATLFNTLYSFVQDMSSSATHHVMWPDEINRLLSTFDHPSTLLRVDFFLRPPTIIGNEHIATQTAADAQLLGLQNLPRTPTEIAQSLVQLKCYRWLVNTLKERGGESHFGELCSILHDVFLGDPRTYRSEVKECLTILIAWIKAASLKEIEIDTPRYSSRLKLRT